MTGRTPCLLAALTNLAACVENQPALTPSQQMGQDLQRMGEEEVKGIDTTGFDALK